MQARLPRALGSVWALWWLLAAAAVLALALGWRAGTAAQAQATATAVALKDLQAVPAQGMVPAPAPDFAVSLGPALPSSRFLAALDRAARDAGVSVVSVVVSERAATANELGRQQFALVLKGSYAGTKQVLAELLARFSGAGVQSMRMRFDPASNTIETSATLALWSAPLR